MKLITLYLNLHESPCLSVQSKLFGLTSVIVDYLWRIILWKPWHDNVEDHHLWTLAAEEEEVIWTKSKRTAEFFRETFPHTFNICTKYNAYMTPGLVFCKTTKWVNESTSWSLGGTFVLLTRFVPFVVPIENCIPWIFKTASVSHDRWLKLLRRWKVFCYAAISSNPCHHWWNCGDFCG